MTIKMFKTKPLIHLYLLNLYYIWTMSLPVGLKNITRDEIKRKELLPPDHVPGAHIEQDGHLNKDYHHEAFLGNMIKDGTLVWENLAGYKKLIKVFHEVDTNGDHQIDKNEMKAWIHDRILEHYNSAKEESDGVFLKVDHDKDGKVSWAEYKAQLFGLDPKSYEKDNETIIGDKHGEFSKEVKHWLNADFNGDELLDKDEFLAFQHPEHNRATLKMMANEITPSYDKNGDGKITLKEYIALPPGEVDPEEEDLDKLYQEEKRKEFKQDMDTNNDDVVDQEEMLAYLDPRHKQHATRESEYLIRTSDRNRDGKISEHEMLMNYAVFTGSSFSNFARVLHDEF